MSKMFYVTTPIYYVNDVPHIGHAYTSLAADTIARWRRLSGDDCRFLTGTDEHGLKIEQAANKTGITPQEHADRYSAPFRKLWDHLDVRYDDFIRTTEPRHKEIVQQIWRRMLEAGDIYVDKYEGWYSVGDEAYIDEEDIVDGKNKHSGHAVSWVEEPSYFFKLSKYGPKLLEYFEAHPEFIQPASRRNEILRFVEQGLRDISISRTTFSWGIPVPEDDAHVIYVWVDALTNYISALGGPDGELFGRYWGEGVEVTHLIGKDILRFHSVYWPAFLMSAGLPLPTRVFAHGWWTHDGEKMSKTLGNVVDPWKMVEAYGADAFRYFLLREVPFGSDGDFSEAALRGRINGELGNGYGNLLNRTAGMIKRYRDGVVPARGAAGAEDEPLLAEFKAAREALIKEMDALSFHKALSAIFGLVSAGNKYVDSAAPWTLHKEGNQARLDEVLYNLAECLRILGIWTLPFLPNKAEALLEQLGVPAELRAFESTLEWGAPLSGIALNEAKPLFPRIEAPKEEKAEAPKKEKKAKGKKATNKKAKKEKKPAFVTPEVIEFEQFLSVKLVAAKVLEAETHPNADRLLKLTVDAGEEAPRTVCAGIASVYTPEEVKGRMVALVANLAPRKIRGVESQGMILAVGEGAEIQLVSVPEGAAPGARIQ